MTAAVLILRFGADVARSVVPRANHDGAVAGHPKQDVLP